MEVQQDPHLRYELSRRTLLAFGVLTLVTGLGTLGFYVIGGGRWTLFETFYLTVITLSTVGYGETLVGMDSQPGARFFAILLIMTGSGTLVFFVSTVTAYIIEADLFGMIRRRRMQKQVDELENHIIVVGVGATGIHVVQELFETKVPFLVVDFREDRIRRAAEQFEGLLWVEGDATDDQVLRAAGIDRAQGLAATLSNDRDNLFVTITARALKPGLRIVTKVIEDSARSKMTRAGADSTVSPSQIGGMRMVSEMVRPNVVEFLDQMLRAEHKQLRVEEVVIPDGVPIVGCELAKTNLRERTGVLILAARDVDGRFRYNPGADFQLEGGMTLVVLSDGSDLTTLREDIRSGAIGPN